MKRTLIASAAIFAVSTLFAVAAPQTFDTPEAAVDAVMAALKAKDRDAVIAVFGADNEDVILSGDVEQDREDWTRFAESYKEMNRIAVQTDGTARLYVGNGQWPFPISIVKADAGWRFDPASARDEILARRIGRNELDVIELLAGYVSVQSDYRRTDYDGDGVMEFAAHVISTQGTRDGLYWPDEDGAPESPIGDFVARASAEGYAVDGDDLDPEPYLGYYFHILTKQGPDAPGGELDYMINGNMVSGHAIIAAPADYGDTGIMTFIVGENGEVYEQDLGDDTLKKAAAIDAFNPGDGWEIADANAEDN
ncbi:MAG: DUF2950 domain-containing protein [Pseudomonadota bacterium]